MSGSSIPLSIPDLRGNEKLYLAKCVDDNWVSSAGPFVAELEARVAEVAGRSQGIAVSNGSSALHLALIALGIEPGDKVVIPDWTFAATANAVMHAGAVPVFTDIADDCWALQPAAAGMAVRKHAAKAVIVVHALGHPADMDALRNACPDGVHMIEDASGAIGATYKDRPVGSLADAAIFSFNGNKVVTAGGGGMIVTDDEKIARRSRHWSTQARVGQEYEHDEAGFNYRMTNINAAVGLAQMERLEEMISSRRRIAKTYDEALSDRPDLQPMPREPWAHSNCWLYSVRTASRAVAQNLVGHLQNQNIEARSFWCSLSRQDPYRDFPVENINNSTMLDGTVVSLPCSSSLQNHEQARVLEAVAGWRGDSLDR